MTLPIREPLATFMLLVTVFAPAQVSPQPADRFEVVSIRRNLTGQGENAAPQPGRYRVRNAPLASLIMGAYGALPERVDGMPEWARLERYDIDATLPAGATEVQAHHVQTMLRERFRLSAHLEQRERPVYALVLARPDGALGPRLRRNPLDCADEAAMARARAARNGLFVCRGNVGRESLTMHAMTLRSVANGLTGAAGRQVIDRTGLEGRFDADLEWAATPDTVDRVSVFTAVQEQLGLRLVADRSLLDVLVVERVERPSPN
jgi:uncharacterized protein (TIGR03435 family)